MKVKVNREKGIISFNNKEALEYLAEQDFDDVLDFVMFIEC